MSINDFSELRDLGDELERQSLEAETATNVDLKRTYNIKVNMPPTPKTKEELKEFINKQIEDAGDNKTVRLQVFTEQITDMSFLFMNKELNFEFLPLPTGRGLSVVEDMAGMFCGCRAFNQDISSWDVSNVKYMNDMFRGCLSFCQDLSKWDVKNVVNMDNMFKDAVEMRQHPEYAPWYDFEHDRKKQNYIEPENQNLKNMSKKDIDDFSDLMALRDEWEKESQKDVETHTSLIKHNNLSTHRFNYFPKTVEELRNIIVKKADAMKKEGNTTLYVGDVDVSKLTSLVPFIFNVDNIRDIAGLAYWSVIINNTKDMSCLNTKDMSCLFYGASSFNGNLRDLSSWVKKGNNGIESMSGMFCGCKAFNQDISDWDVSHVKYMNDMFRGCLSFRQDLSKWDVKNVVNMDNMFKDAIEMRQHPEYAPWYDFRHDCKK